MSPIRARTLHWSGAAARAALLFGLSAWLCGASQRAAAQVDVDVDRFSPALDPRGFLGVQGTRTPGHLRPSYGLFVWYGKGLLEVERPDGSEAILVSDRLSAQLSAELGLLDRGAIALTLPMALYQTGDELTGDAGELPAVALADPGVHARYRLIGDTGERDDGPGLALQIGATFPLGADNAYTGEGAVRGYAQLLADFHAFGFGGGLSLGVRHRFQERDLFGESLNDEFTFGGAVRMPIPPLHPLSVLVEVRGATDFQSAETTAVEGEIAGLFDFSELTLAVSVGTGFTGGFGTPDVRAIAGLWYAPRDSDTDKDGIDDDDDKCPPLPEDLDGYQDEDGCPDPDNDNDLVPDVDDLCPNDEALEGRDEDEDGCTDP